MVRFCLLALAATAPASASVVNAADHAFEISQSVDVPLPPDKAWTLFERVGEWWNPDHTYSGKAANLRMALSVGACMCEMFEATGGGVEHLRVSYAEPNKRAVLTGSLGPLLYEATAGAMDVTFKPQGKGTRVSMTYRVVGFARGNGKAMAPLVDRVLGEQMGRYRALASR